MHHSKNTTQPGQGCRSSTPPPATAPRAAPTRKRVGGVDPALVALAQHHPHASLLGVLGCAVVVVHHRQQDQRVHHHLCRLRSGLLGRSCSSRSSLHGRARLCCLPAGGQRRGDQSSGKPNENAASNDRDGRRSKMALGCCRRVWRSRGRSPSMPRCRPPERPAARQAAAA